MTTPPEFNPTEPASLTGSTTPTSPTGSTLPGATVSGSGEAFVPRLDADPSTAPYEELTPDVAVDRIAAAGFARADAEYIVTSYLREHTARFGEPAGGWRIDPYDLADIAQRWGWVDQYRGETIADARARVAEYAAGYQRLAAKIDRDQDPHHAAMLDREVAVWAELARAGDDPGPIPDARPENTDTRLSAREQISARAALAEVALARAAGQGYVLVGPSARTWIRDPATGQPTREASDAEHQAVRDLLGSNALDATEPEWVTTPDGQTDLHATVIPTDSTADDDLDDDDLDDDDLDDDDLDDDDLDEEIRPQGWWARANSPGEPTVTFDASGYYTDAQIAEIAAALNDAGDVEGDAAGRREQLTRWHHDDHPTDYQVTHELGASDYPDGIDGAGWVR